MARATQRPSARRDFIVHYVYLAEHASPAIAEGFRSAVEATYAELAAMPLMGSPGKVRDRDVRLWRVRGFESYLVAYRPHREGVAIERLIHAKQDYTRILG